MNDIDKVIVFFRDNTSWLLAISGALITSFLFLKINIFMRIIYRFRKTTKWKDEVARLNRRGIEPLVIVPEPESFLPWTNVDFSLVNPKLSIRGNAHEGCLEEAEEWLDKFLRHFRGDLEFVFEINVDDSNFSSSVSRIIILLARSQCKSLLVRWKYVRFVHTVHFWKEYFDKVKTNEAFVFYIQDRGDPPHPAPDP